MSNKALSVAEKLTKQRIELKVIDPKTFVPLDIDMIVKSVRRTSRLIICDEAVEHASWAGYTAIHVMGMRSIFSMHRSPAYAERMSPRHIAPA
jgi:acetoin:2,6-dichlorophenolindophenol oxidoreductase subunit beta